MSQNKHRLPPIATCKMIGGLGNQLFQIFATAAYALKYNRRFVISDIHGCKKTLAELIYRLDLQPDDALFFLGDYIDRGPSSKQVVQRIMDIEEETVCLLGNHEHMMLDEMFYNKMKVSLPKFLWEFNGGNRTMNSFGYDTVEEFIEKLDKKTFDFFKNLKITHKEDIEYEGRKLGFIFAHAGLYPHNPLETQLGLKGYTDFSEFYSQEKFDHSNSPVWVRNSFFEGNPDFWKGNIVVHQ